jgi:FtsP/CotA-like multicopper oxidase with cupredoxin domain
MSSAHEISRRSFLSAAAGGGLLVNAPDFRISPADVILHIAPTRLEVAPGQIVTTTTYNGSAPGPLIRLREGIPFTVQVFNHTDLAEYVHWHGFEISAELDGSEEENSLPVPARGHIRYQITPNLAGSRYVHSHAMAMDDLSRGVYSGQFAFVYVEPKKNPGKYDQEIFLSTHEWQPFFTEGEDEQNILGEIVEENGETDWGPSFVEVGYGIHSINGKALGHGEPIRVRERQRVLFHILNASATENIQLYLPGHEFVVVALDGNPVPRPQRVGVLELGAAERVDAFVDMNHPGVWILGSTDEDMRGNGLGILIEYVGKRGIATYEKPHEAAWDYRSFGENREHAKPNETIPMVIERLNPDATGHEYWTINGKTYSNQQEAKILQKGSRYRLVFVNRTGDAHPLHLHRNTFELSQINGKPTSGVRKDVMLLKPYQTAAVDFTPQQQGLVLFHCHQQMHMDQGFKTLFRVV